MNGQALRRAGISVVVLVWLFAVIAGYYVIHKPITLESFAALPDSLGHILGPTVGEIFGAFANVAGDAATVLCIIILASGLGRRLASAWTFETALEQVVLWTGIGLGALGLLGFVLALIGLVQTWACWILVIVGLVFLRNDLLVVWRALRAISLPRPTRGDTALAVFCALALVVTFLFALTPPWGWDGLQYHLVTPKLILENGRMLPPADNLSLNNPNLVEMLFMLGMILKGDGAAQPLHWIYLPLTLGAMLVFAQKYFSARIGWLACALFCAVPTIALLSTWAYNDLALTFYTFAAFALTLRARETGDARDFVLVGVLCGFAFGEKVTAFFAPLAFAALLFRPQRPVLQNILLMLGVAGALALPWWVRNLVFVGNPVYPFVFGGKYWDSFRTMWYTRFGSGLLQRPLELLVVPWTMTIFGTQSDLFQGTLGPLLLALLPLNLIPSSGESQDSRRPARAMWFLVAVLYGVWLIGVAQSNLLWQSRLLLPAFPLLCLLAAVGLGRLSGLPLPQFSIQRVATMIVAIVFGLTAFGYALAFLSDHALGYFFGAVSRQEYLTGVLGAHYTTAEWVNDNLPAGARVLFLWEPRTYYFARDTEADAILDRFVHLNYLYGDADKIADALRAQGFTYVLLYREGLDNILQTGYDPITDADVAALNTFVSKDLKTIYGAPGFGLETRNGKFGLANPHQDPYTVYELNAP